MWSEVVPGEGVCSVQGACCWDRRGRGVEMGGVRVRMGVGIENGRWETEGQGKGGQPGSRAPRADGGDQSGGAISFLKRVSVEQVQQELSVNRWPD